MQNCEYYTIKKDAQFVVVSKKIDNLHVFYVKAYFQIVPPARESLN